MHGATSDTAKVGQVLQRRATHAEGWLSVCRLTFTVVLSGRFFALAVSRPQVDAVHVLVSSIAMISVTIFSVGLIWRWRSGAIITRGWMTFSVIVDVLVCFGALLTNGVFPGDDYLGVLVNPDLASMLVIVAASGLRMSPRLAAISASMALVSGVFLVLADTFVSSATTSNSEANAVLWGTLWFGVAACAWLYAKWSRALLGEVATQTSTVAHLRGGIEALLQTHHDARGGLTSLTLRLDRLAETGAVRGDSDELEALRTQLEFIRRSIGQIQREAAGQLIVAKPKLPADVASVAHAVMSFAKERSPSLDLETSVTHDLPAASVCGGSAGLARVLDNLVINAIEGDGVSGAETIQLHAIARRNSVAIRVSDDGPGIGPGIGTGLRSKPGHTGIGLQACRAIVEDSGGSFSLQSSDAGTRVEITLPVAGNEEIHA
ncbi:MAG: ATP-binding protein [Myxococcota bacterium]